MNVEARLHNQGLGPDGLGRGRPVHERKEKRKRDRRQAEECGHQDQNHDRRDGQQDIGCPHRNLVHQAAEPGRAEAQPDTQHQGQDPRQEPETDRIAQPVEQFREDVHPAVVYPEPMGRGGRTEGRERHVVRVIRGQERAGQDRYGEHDGQVGPGQEPWIPGKQWNNGMTE